MTPRRKIHLLLGGSLCCALSFVKADAVPGGFPVGRYSSLWEHSPFTISSVQQEVVPPGFADKLALVGVAKIGDDDMVTLLNKESLERINLSSNSSPQGLKIVSVELNVDPLKACVTIQKGNETAKVKFDKIAAGGTPASPTGNNSTAPSIAPGVARPIPAQPRVPVSARVVRIISPAPYTGQANEGGVPLPPTPGSQR